jgi:hypothetical protein
VGVEGKKNVELFFPYNLWSNRLYLILASYIAVNNEV